MQITSRKARILALDTLICLITSEEDLPRNVEGTGIGDETLSVAAITTISSLSVRVWCGIVPDGLFYVLGLVEAFQLRQGHSMNNTIFPPSIEQPPAQTD